MKKKNYLLSFCVSILFKNLSIFFWQVHNEHNPETTISNKSEKKERKGKKKMNNTDSNNNLSLSNH